MEGTRGALLSALIMITSTLVASTALAAPTTLTVCDTGCDHTSIQAAIDAAAAGDTVEVANGTYAEDVTVDVENLALVGPNAGTAGDGNRTTEATITGQVVVTASGVTLDGFDISPPDPTTNAKGEALRISGTPDDVTVTNNIVRDFNGSALPTWEGADAIVAFGGDGTDAIQNVEITRNLVQNIQGRDTQGGATGISLLGNVQGATVEGNVVESVGMEATAWAFGLVVRGTGNHAEVPPNVELTHNTVTQMASNPATGTVAVGIGSEADASQMTVLANSVSDVELLVENKDTANTLDVTANWWGDANGPDTAENPLETTAAGIGGAGETAYLPWLDAPAAEDGSLTGPVENVGQGLFYLSIQPSIDEANAGDTIEIRGATYTEALSIPATKTGLTLSGAGEDTVTVNASAAPAYGLEIAADDVTVEGISLIGPADGNYGIHAADTPEDLTGLTIQEMTIRESASTELDLHAVQGATVSNVTLLGQGTGGNGLAVTDSHDVTVSNLTTSGNTWGGFAIYTSGSFVDIGTSGITLTGDNSIDEVNPVYLQGPEGTISDLDLQGYPIEIEYGSSPDFQFRQPDVDAALDAVVTLSGDSRLDLATATILEPSADTWHAVDGMQLGLALDAADAGDTIHAHGGTYAEQLSLDQSLTLTGEDGATIQAPGSLAGDADGYESIVTITDGANAEVSGLTISGPGPGSCGSITSGIAVRDGADAEIRDSRIESIRDDPLSGCQNGVGVMVGRVWYDEASDSTATATIENVTIVDFQKSAVTVTGDASDATIEDSTLTCSGSDADDTIAQDAIQIWQAASADIVGNEIADCIAEIGGTPLGTSIHLSNGVTDTRIADNTIRDGEAAIALMNFAGFAAGEPAIAEDLEIVDNTITGNRGGIYLAGAGDDITVSGNNVTGQSVFGLFLGPDTWIQPPGIWFTDVNVTGNAFANQSAPAILVRESAEALQVHFNSFSGNDLAILNEDNPTVDATHNWWGSPLGPTLNATATPATGDSIVGPVHFAPFCLEAGCTANGVVHGSPAPHVAQGGPVSEILS